MTASDFLESKVIELVLEPETDLTGYQFQGSKDKTLKSAPRVEVLADARVASGFEGMRVDEYEGTLNLVVFHLADDTTQATAEEKAGVIFDLFDNQGTLQGLTNVSGTGLHIYSCDVQESSTDCEGRFWRSVLTFRIQFAMVA